MEGMETLGEVLKREFKMEIPDNSNETPEERKARLKKISETKCEGYNSSIGDLNQKDGYDCKICKNKGGLFKTQEYNGNYHEVYSVCKCMKIRNVIAKIKRSGLKDVVHSYTFDKYQDTEEWQKFIKQKALQFIADDENTWFFIGGQSGAGKTHICTAISMHYLKKGMDFRYMLWRDDVQELKAVINDSEQYKKKITELKEAEVLYIDDLFKMGKDESGNAKAPTASDINLAFEILNYRYNNKKLITIMSSERKMTELIAIDEAIGGRISEMTVPAGYNIALKNDPKRNYRTKGIIEV